MTLYDNEENAVINNPGGVSETPSNLVKESPNETYEKGSQHGSQLSPNPAGFGFTKQYIVDELPENGAPNTLYLLKVLNGGLLVGYKQFKWTPSEGFVQFGATPDLKLEKGEHEQKAVENNQPKRAPEKVFNGDVVFGGDIYYKGGKLKTEDEGSIVKPNPVLAGTETSLTGLEIDGVKYKVDQPINVAANPTLAGTENELSGLQVGSTKYKVITSSDVTSAINTAIYGAIDANY